jgi:hypothetical protein
MKRAAVFIALGVLATACTDDRVGLSRGPLGPASYEVQVRAQETTGRAAERHSASLNVVPTADGATFSLRAPGGEVITADLRLLEDGSVDLARVHGPGLEGSGQTELASLVGQLNPPLPARAVRIGQRWSSTQLITTKTLSASLRTTLRIVRFRRIASTDAAELLGRVSGHLRVNGIARPLEGRLTGETDITWAVSAGRVVAADTELVWELSDGSRVMLSTSVTPR